jgi:hypothetical protein
MKNTPAGAERVQWREIHPLSKQEMRFVRLRFGVNSFVEIIPKINE